MKPDNIKLRVHSYKWLNESNFFIILQFYRVTKQRERTAASIRRYDFAEDHYDEEEEGLVVSGGEEEDYQYPAVPPPQQKQWVDYDNVEDDDPFNLFGTSKPDSGVLTVKQHVSDSEEEDRDRYRGRRDRDRDHRSASHRQGKWNERGSSYGKSDKIGAGDLRAKLVGRRRNNTRNW